MAKPRKRNYQATEIDLSPNMRAIVTPQQVILFDRMRQGFALTLREAQVLAEVVGDTNGKVNLAATL